MQPVADLDETQRRSEDRNAILFLSGLLILGALVAYFNFGFYTWTVELACCVIYLAIFMFAFSTKDYSSETKSLFWGTGFLFTTVFEALYFYTVARAGRADFGLFPEAGYFWICVQWFQAVSFLIAVNRNVPQMRLPLVITVCAGVTVVLLAASVGFPQVIRGWETTYRGLYFGINEACIVLFYGVILALLIHRWGENPPYFAWRSLVGVVFSAAASVGLSFGPETGPLLIFVFSYFRFLGLALAYNANVTYTLHSPYRRMHDQLVADAELKHTLELLHNTQDQLVQSAKLSASGQLIAGISHDLNTPLAAIQSASDMLQSTVREFGRTLVQGWDRLDQDQRDLFFRVLSEGVASESFLDSTGEREARQDLTVRARQAGHRQAAELARLLEDSGLVGHEALIASFLALKDPLALARALEPLATVQQLSSVIFRAGDRAASVVGALRVLLRGHPGTERTSIDVKQSVEEILPLFHTHRRKGLTLTVELESARVSGWPEKLTQVWVNLITNAIQAAGPQGKVHISLKNHEGWVLVSIEDNGPEIPSKIRDRIFEVFFTTKATGEGTGLGLYVCRQITEELGGRITFESDPQRTVFLVSLPAEPKG